MYTVSGQSHEWRIAVTRFPSKAAIIVMMHRALAGAYDMPCILRSGVNQASVSSPLSVKVPLLVVVVTALISL